MDEHLLRFDKEKTFVFIDCETENLCLNHRRNLPWQVGMIKCKGGEPIDQKDIYIKWDRELNVSKEAARITKFSPTRYKKASVLFEEIFPTIQDWLDNADYIVGHNLLGFDIYLIKDMYTKAGKDYRHLMPKIIDTLSLAKGINGGDPYKSGEDFLVYQYRMLSIRKKGLKASLLAVGKQYDIDFDPNTLHDAVNDLKLNLAVWNKMKWQGEV